MRSRVRPLAIAVLAALLSALLAVNCTSWRREKTSPRDVLTAQKRDQVRVTLVGGARLELRDPWIEGDSLLGYQGTVPTGGERTRWPHRRSDAVAIPLESVLHVELPHLDAGKSIGLVLGIGVTIAVVAILLDSGHESTPVTFGGGGGDEMMSCPLVWSWDGLAWKLDSGTYAGAIMPALARTGVDELEHARAEGGIVRLRLTGLSGETEHVDALSLLVVDHDPGVAAVPDGAGGLHSVGESRAPTRARDFAGRDALPRVAKADGWCWESVPVDRDPAIESDLHDGLELDFARPPGARNAALVVDATNTPWAAHLMREVVAMHGSGTQAWYDAVGADSARAARIRAVFAREAFLRVSIWCRDGWQPQGMIWESGPEVLKQQAVHLDLSGAEGDAVRVRLDSAPNLWLVDRVAIDYTPERELTAKEVRPGQARDLAGRDIRRLLAAEDRVEYVMTPADTAEVTFQVPPIPAGQTRTYLARTTGWYRIRTPESGEPQTAITDRLETEPGAVARFAVTRMNRALATMAAGR